MYGTKLMDIAAASGGFVPIEQIRQSIDVLNGEYGGKGYVFSLAQSQDHQRPDWFQNADLDASGENDK